MPDWSPLFFAVSLIIGFWSPGAALARLLGSPSRFAVPFLLSLVLLFHAAFWPLALGVPLRWPTVALLLLGTTAALALAALRRPAPEPEAVAPPSRWPERLLLAGAVLVGALLAFRCALVPLNGYDTYWRWDYLARCLLEQGHLDFYPPRTADDFAIYSYAEGIPPLVSVSYWWLYAAAGRPLPTATALLIAAQYGAILLFTYRIAARLFSLRAGVIAVAGLASSLLFLRAVAIGQETGLTALSLAGMTAALVSAREGRDSGAMVLGGLAAALGALAREYGWAFVPCGLLLLLWRRRSAREMAVFTVAACAAAAPWYGRNALLTGNPLFSNRFLGLPVNEAHAALIDFYRQQLGVAGWSAGQWSEFGQYLLSVAPLPLLLGAPAALLLGRRHGYLGIAALVVTVLCLTSIGYTSGLFRYALRVLSPALVVLSVLAGGLVDRLPWRPARALVLVAAAVLLARAALYALVYPYLPFTAPPTVWPRMALEVKRRAPSAAEDALPGLVSAVLPPGSRLLAENTYAHAALAGSEYPVVMVWGPEVAFLFDPSLDARAVEERLRQRGIVAVIYNPESLNSRYLDRLPFYRDGRPRWRKLAALEGTKTVVYGMDIP